MRTLHSIHNVNTRLIALLLVVYGIVVSPSVQAQDAAEPKLPSVTDQHGVQLNSGSISVRYFNGGIGPQRRGLSRSRFRSENGYTPGVNDEPRDSVLDFQVHYSDETNMFSISAEEIMDRFKYNQQTKLFEPVNATVSTLDNVAGSDNFTDLVYTAPSGAVYTYKALINYSTLTLHEVTAEMALLKKVEYPDGEVWTNGDGVNPSRYDVRSNSLGFVSYPELKNLGYMPASGQYVQNDWPGEYHQTHPTYVRGQTVTGTYYYGNGNTAPFPIRNRDATITYANGDEIKANFIIQTASSGWPEIPRVKSIERYGSTWTYAYTESGDDVSTTTVTSPSGTKEKYFFHTDENRKGKLYKRELIPSGGGTSLITEYDYSLSTGRLDRVIYPEGNKTELTRDSSGRITEVRKIAKPGSSVADMVVSYTYDACSASNRNYCARPRTYTDERGNITKYTYSATHGGVTEVQLPYVAGEGYRKTVTEYGQFHAWYKASGQGSTQVKDNRAVWRKTKEITCVTSSEGTNCADGSANVTVTEYHYEQGNASTPSNVNLIQVVTRAGDSSVSSTVSYEYDTWGRKIAEDGPLAGSSDKVWYEYDKRDNITRTTTADPDGSGPQQYRYERHEYNAVNQVTMTETGRTTSYNPSSRVDTILTSVLYSHDSYGRLTNTTTRDNSNSAVSLSQTSYDSSSRIDCQALRMDTSSYNALPSSACTLTGGSDPADRITKTHYDAYNRAFKTSFALGTSVEMHEERTFSNNGLEKTVKDGNGNLTTYEYDGLDRLYQTRFPNKTGGGSSATDMLSVAYATVNGKSTPLVQYEYKRSHLQGTPAQVSFTYDSLGRVTLADATGTNNDVTTTYDEFGNVETLTRNGKAIIYDWDALGRLTNETTTISGQSFAVSYLYDAAGRRTRMTYPDGFYVTYEYWGSGGLKYIKENGSNTIASYEYDAHGRGNKLTFGNGVYRELDFDSANRVSDLDYTVPSDTGYNQQIDYGFNVASQVTSKILQNNLYLPTDHGSTSTYSVNGLNQITGETSDGSTLNVTYDKNGNLTSDGVTTFGYDLFNRLTSVSGGTSFDYDASGRLYSITNGSTNTYFIYDGKALIGEYTVGGGGSVSLQRRYVHGLDVDTPIVWYEGSAVSNTTRRYLIRDELGSVVLVTDSNGDALHHNVYDEYGVPGTNNAGRFQYTGQTWLEEAGLYYYKARVYSPYLGRFHQTDPIGYGDGLNMYAYVSNDPINNTDPTGKVCLPCVPLVLTGLEKAFIYTVGALVVGAAVQEAVNNVETDSGENSSDSGENSSAPELPDELVGNQDDPRAGPNRSGTTHNSGTLRSDKGGTNDYDADLETLAGETRPAEEGDPAPEGSQIGENGVFGRETNSVGGRSIDIPANGEKPHETLHYPPRDDHDLTN